MGTLIPILAMILAYLVGSIPFGLIIGKLKGIDIREKGSHNIGATNVFRTIGPWYGGLVFLLDALKSAIFVIFFKYIFLWNDPFFTLQIHPLIYGGLAILGHLFPIYLKFKGGKGISCFAGVMLSYSIPISLIALFTFIIVLFITKIVSISSILSSLSLIIAYFIIGKTDFYLLGFISIMFILVIIKHRSNIVRLFKGTENKIHIKKKNEK
jgi:acyl-phosphate glycerol 3-phosphate acyltransferase